MSNPTVIVRFTSMTSRAQHSLALQAGQPCVVGSAAGECQLAGDGVLPEHARLLLDGGEAFVEPVAGAAVTLSGATVDKPAKLNDGDWLLLGATALQVRIVRPAAAASAATVMVGQVPPPKPEPESAATILLGEPVSLQPAPPAVGQGRVGLLVVGRLPQCDVMIPSPLVSRQHAKLVQQPGGWTVEDCQSTNGTFLNGRRVEGSATIKQGDRLAFAAFEFLFTGDSLEPFDQIGRVRIEARHLTKAVRDSATGATKKLLDDINLVIEPGEFVVLFGTSGSGKSTLLDALNGRRPATGGAVLYNGTDLYAAFDLYRSAIGYVPQQDIVHRKIVVQRALHYTARLRLPPDTTDMEMDGYVGQVLDKVGLAEKAAMAIDTPAPLSGGQLKRVSLAVELVANPNVLFLDEVTSGLDAGTDKRMMELFRALAADQKTVVCVTHTLENIEACHLVVLLHRGKLVFYGPPQAVTGYFGIHKLSEVYELLESRPAEEWAGKFQASSFHETYVRRRLHPDGASAGSNTTQPTAPKRRWFDWLQTATLMQRNLDLMLADRRNLLILILQAPLIALVIGLVFKIDSALALRAAKESQIAFILVLSAIWFGCLNSARELVKELPIYLRERSVNLGLAPYLISKLIPLAGLCLLQCALLLGVVATLVSIPGDMAARFGVLFASSMAATAMGLAVSAFVNSNDKAVATVPILLIPQVILSGAVVKLEGGGLWIAKLTIIAYWAFDAMKATLSDEVRAVRDFAGEALVPVAGSVGGDLGLVAALGLVFLAAAVLGLKLKDKK